MSHLIKKKKKNPTKVNGISIRPSRRTNKRKHRQPSSILIAPPDLSLHAICWVKIRGFMDWPGVIEGQNGGKYKIHFFGDYTTGLVGRAKIANFFEGFSLFQDNFDKPLLKKAIEEACICLIKHPTPNTCLV